MKVLRSVSRRKGSGPVLIVCARDMELLSCQSRVAENRRELSGGFDAAGSHCLASESIVHQMMVSDRHLPNLPLRKYWDTSVHLRI